MRSTESFFEHKKIIKFIEKVDYQEQVNVRAAPLIRSETVPLHLFKAVKNVEDFIEEILDKYAEERSYTVWRDELYKIFHHEKDETKIACAKKMIALYSVLLLVRDKKRTVRYLTHCELHLLAKKRSEKCTRRSSCKCDYCELRGGRT
jgi:hypothetical protein